jgi:hypothetical protein
MPTGIARSLFTSKFATALGCTVGTVRHLYNREGYAAPYTDIHRALRIHKAAGHDIPKLLRAVNRRHEDIEWDDPGPKPPTLEAPPANALVLTPAPSQPPINGSQHLPVQRHADMTMLARLARATPEGDTPENMRRIKETLNADGFDLRNKNENKAVEILRRHGFTVTHVQPREALVAEDPDSGSFPNIDTLGVVQLRELCRELLDQNNRLSLETSAKNIRLAKVGRILTMSHDRLIDSIVNGGQRRITPAENAAVDALHAVERKFQEDV